MSRQSYLSDPLYPLYLGCYNDSLASRDIAAAATPALTPLTVETCRNSCRNAGKSFSGVQVKNIL